MTPLDRANAKLTPELAKRDAEIERLRAELVAVRRSCADLLEDKHRLIMDLNNQRYEMQMERDRLRSNLTNLVVACEHGGSLEAALADARAALEGKP